MQGYITENIWKRVQDAFVVLPESPWIERFCLCLQQRGYDLARANRFVTWVQPPGKGTLDTYEYLVSQLQPFELYESEKATRTVGFEDVVVALREGKSARRTKWHESWKVTRTEHLLQMTGLIFGKPDRWGWTITYADLMATDWQIV